MQHCLTGYKKGCRCPVCKKAKSENHKKYKKRITTKFIITVESNESIKHGSLYAYNVKKCRCKKCVIRANKCRKKARDKALEKARLGQIPDNAHGHNGYVHYGCRCKICSDAAKEYNLNKKIRDKEKREAARYKEEEIKPDTNPPKSTGNLTPVETVRKKGKNKKNTDTQNTNTQNTDAKPDTTQNTIVSDNELPKYAERTKGWGTFSKRQISKTIGRNRTRNTQEDFSRRHFIILPQEKIKPEIINKPSSEFTIIGGVGE